MQRFEWSVFWDDLSDLNPVHDPYITQNLTGTHSVHPNLLHSHSNNAVRGQWPKRLAFVVIMVRHSSSLTRYYIIISRTSQTQLPFITAIVPESSVVWIKLTLKYDYHLYLIRWSYKCDTNCRICLTIAKY